MVVSSTSVSTSVSGLRTWVLVVMTSYPVFYLASKSGRQTPHLSHFKS